MPQLQRIGRAHTQIQFTRPDRTVTRTMGREDEGHIIFHGKHIVCWNEDYIALRNHGHFTMTTRTRMNQTSNQFHLGYLVYQRTIHGQKKWFINWMGMELDFNGGLILNRPHDRDIPPPHRPRRSRRAPSLTETRLVGRSL